MNIRKLIVVAGIGGMFFIPYYAEAQPKNVFSVNTLIVDIQSSQGATSFSLNSGYFYEYDRQLSPLISIAPFGNLSVDSEDNQTTTNIGLGGALRFWPSKKFEGFYVGPAFSVNISSQAGGSTTFFYLAGDLGYRFLIRNFALTAGGMIGFGFGNNVTQLRVAGKLGLGLAF